MVVSPDTDIKILKGVPLSKTYEHTVHYPNATEQENGFNSYAVHHLTNYSYQRVGLGTIRVNLPYAVLYNCNYMMFKNTAYDSKMFYAFITGCSYVSDNVTEVYYEIDVMQTFCYDYEFLPSFVERQHPKTDIIFENTQPEGLELGPDYYVQDSLSIPLISTDDSKKKFVLIATSTPTGGKISVKLINNTVYSVYRAILTGVSEIVETVQLFVDNGIASNIIGIYTAPSDDVINIANLKHPSHLDWYKPKNMKLWSYPYCFIEMNNHLGESIELKYENFRKTKDKEHVTSKDYEYSFEVFKDFSIIPEAKLVPLNYNHSSGGTSKTAKLNYGYNVGYSLFPQGAVSDDSFKVWLAQNQSSYVASLNAIGNIYDTNQAIAINNYSMAERTASAGLASNSASINTTLNNAMIANNTAVDINNRNANVSTGNALVNGIASSAANLASLNIGGAVGSAVGMLTAGVNIQNQTQNTADTLSAQLAGSVNSAGTAMANAKLAYSTAMKNASTSYLNATLSNLTTANNATAQLVAKKQDAQHQPNNLHGQVMNGGFNASYNLVGFSIFQKCIKKEYAMMIDDYFEKYGYAIRKMMTPRRVVERPHWQYLKTCGCSITGNLNAQDMQAIQAIYNNGITTWTTLNEVGHYELDNHVGVLEER